MSPIWMPASTVQYSLAKGDSQGNCAKDKGEAFGIVCFRANRHSASNAFKRNSDFLRTTSLDNAHSDLTSNWEVDWPSFAKGFCRRPIVCLIMLGESTNKATCSKCALKLNIPIWKYGLKARDCKGWKVTLMENSWISYKHYESLSAYNGNYHWRWQWFWSSVIMSIKSLTNYESAC